MTPPPTRQKRNVPAAMDKVVGLFMKESNQYWKVIETNLRAAGHNPTLCLEAARAHKQGMHHDVELARAYNSALSDAKKRCND